MEMIAIAVSSALLSDNAPNITDENTAVSGVMSSKKRLVMIAP